jgi:hypothetical protein
MKRKRKGLLVAGMVVASLALLLMSGFASARPLADACGPGCYRELACWQLGPSLRCKKQCVCPGGEGVTPGVTPIGTYVPPPTPTPIQGEVGEIVCVPWCPSPYETMPVRVEYTWDGVMVAWWPAGGCCDPPCPCAEPGDERQPCTPDDETMSCEDEMWGAEVECELPAWYADQQPYPRGLVGVPVRFRVEDFLSRTCEGRYVHPSGDAECASCFEDEDNCSVGTMCKYRLLLKAEPVENVPPTWWCEDDGGGIGFEMGCVWQRSSWGKPELGKGLNCEPLPAFTVGASVPYWWYLADEYDVWSERCVDSECYCAPGDGTPECSEDCPEGTHPVNVCEEKVYYWDHHGPEWELLDMSLIRPGGPPYAENPNLTLVTHPPCDPDPVSGAIHVPVIEVQAPIEEQP